MGWKVGSIEKTIKSQRDAITRPRANLGPQLEDEFQSKLDLTRGESGVGFQEALGLLVVGGVRDAIHKRGVLGKRGRLGSEAVGGDGDALVVVVEQVEGIGGELET